MAEQDQVQKPQKSFEETISALTHDQLIALARVTESAERYENMCAIMGKIVKLKKELSVEERNMLSVAYKNVVGQRRASWRALTLTNFQEGDLKCEDPKALEALRAKLEVLKTDYMCVVEMELNQKCQEVLDLLSNNLLKTAEHEDMKKLVETHKNSNDVPDATKNASRDALETQVFYLKMSGDYYRYLAEFNAKNEHKTKAETKYKEALALSEVLAPTHPTRLGLALNASVCYWEIMKKPDAACQLAKKAFDEAIQKLDSLSDSTYKDSTLIMQLLRDNLTIWTAESEHGDNSNKPANNQQDD